ncbi:hypothetical protein J4410_06185 [Candidatus Woesearchaeota archaeon]|nr:hypothetical protein [Candidatus Woesearchaeota archaeon]
MMSDVCLGNREGSAHALEVKGVSYGHWDVGSGVRPVYLLGIAQELAGQDLRQPFSGRRPKEVPSGFVCEDHLREILAMAQARPDEIEGMIYGIPEKRIRPVQICGFVGEGILEEKLPGLVWYVHHGFGRI